MLELLRWLTLFLGGAAALLALRAATIPIRDTLEFRQDLIRQPRWSTWAAAVTVVTALLLVLQIVLE